MTPEKPETGKLGPSDDLRADLARSGWSVPKPETIPRPTAAPAAVALGVTLIAFGGLTSWIVSIAGTVLTIGALARWLTEMHHAADE